MVLGAPPVSWMDPSPTFPFLMCSTPPIYCIRHCSASNKDYANNPSNFHPLQNFYPAQTISTGFKGAIDALVTVQNHYGLMTHGCITLDADITRVTKFRRGNSVGLQRRREIEEDCYLVRRFDVYGMGTTECIENLIQGVVSIIQELLGTQSESATDWINATPVDWQQDLAQRLLDSNGNQLRLDELASTRKWKYLSGLVG